MEDLVIDSDNNFETYEVVESVDYVIYLEKIIETNYYIIAILSVILGVIMINSIFNNLTKR